MEEYDSIQSENITPEVTKETSNRSKKPLFVFIIVAVILVLLVIVGLTSKESGDIPLGDVSEDTVKNEDVSVKEDTNLNSQTGLTAILAAYTGRPLREVRIGEGFNVSEEVISLQTQNLKELVAAVEENPENVEAWIGVGVVKKFFNDYEGARDVWEYAGTLFPSNAVTFGNLGNLYGFYLGDKEKAVLNYERAVLNIPFDANYYLALADFYKEVDIDNQQKAVQVILTGLKNIPDDLNLLLFLASFYRDTGDSKGAIEYYNKVLEVSPGHAGIAEEIERLSN